MATLENREGRFIAPSDHTATGALAGAEMPANLRVFVPNPAGADSYPIVTFSWSALSELPQPRQISPPLR